MSVDQDELRNTAKQLRVLYEELDEAKYEKPPAPEVSTQGANQQKGPSEPFPIWTLSDDVEFTSLLSEYVNDAARFVKPEGEYYRDGFGRDGIKMCRWIAWNAGAIAELDVADVMLDELRHQVRELDMRLKRSRPFQPAGKEEGEAWLTARSICYTLRQQGHNVTPELLRKWAERGEIIVKSNGNRRNIYLMTQVLSKIRLSR
ncbi:MAG: hypothetical protein HLX46_02860 [Corynebacterium sp.]|uniref:hypothetical protein n=1 Tax=Corynebacterium sp. TaxID=1720 RepID=UPI001817FC8A|nr:hypothetical protein [Corynebacterium sp.]NWO15791.1 hypothetical protein [Corynebacterium sp.]